MPPLIKGSNVTLASRSGPDPFDDMLKTVPAEIRANVEKLLRGFGITNNDDPLVQIATALTVYAAYFEKIPQYIVEAGNVNKSQMSESLSALDTRLAFLRSMTILLQQAVDRLDKTPQQIVDKFPIQQIIETLENKVRTKLDALPLRKFEESVGSLNAGMERFNDKADHYARRQEQAMESQEAVLKRVESHHSQQSSYLLGIVATLFAGVALGAGLIWVTCVWPLMTILNNQSFIGANAMAGVDNNGPFLYVARGKMEGYTPDAQGNLTIRFKTTPTPDPTGH